MNVILTPDDELLLIPTRQSARRERRIRRADIKGLDDLARALLNGVLIEKHTARERDNRRTIMHAENRVLRKTKLEQEPATMTIFGDVRDSEFAPDARAERVEIPAFEIDLTAESLR